MSSEPEEIRYCGANGCVLRAEHTGEHLVPIRLAPLLDLDTVHLLDRTDAVRLKVDGSNTCVVVDLSAFKVEQVVTALSDWLAKIRGDGTPTLAEQESARAIMVAKVSSEVPPPSAFMYRCTYCGSPTSRDRIRLEDGYVLPSCCSRDGCIDRWNKKLERATHGR